MFDLFILWIDFLVFFKLQKYQLYATLHSLVTFVKFTIHTHIAVLIILKYFLWPLISFIGKCLGALYTPVLGAKLSNSGISLEAAVKPRDHACACLQTPFLLSFINGMVFVQSFGALGTSVLAQSPKTLVFVANSPPYIAYRLRVRKRCITGNSLPFIQLYGFYVTLRAYTNLKNHGFQTDYTTINIQIFNIFNQQPKNSFRFLK